MPIASMTGFARENGAATGYAWHWEVRSVNGRGLDVRCRLPPGFDHLEPSLRAAAGKRLARGNLTLSLALTQSPPVGKLVVNRELLDQVIALAGELQASAGVAPPRLDGLLAIRGVVETRGPEADAGADEGESPDAAILASLDRALAALHRVRQEEGAKLGEALGGHLDEIGSLAAAARGRAEAQPGAIKRKLEERLAELVQSETAIVPERLAQEVAMLAARADVREELDRLEAHLGAARALLAEGGTIGRRLEFLTQEFNRESNTLCSKSADIELTRLGLALKAAIDRLREQSLNIE